MRPCRASLYTRFVTLLQEPPFLTITSMGGPGLAFVQTEPCAVLRTCLVAKMLDAEAAKFETAEEKLAQYFLVAAVITHNSWRFNYSEPCKFADIAKLPLPVIADEDRSELVQRIKGRTALVGAYILSVPRTD